MSTSSSSLDDVLLDVDRSSYANSRLAWLLRVEPIKLAFVGTERLRFAQLIELPAELELLCEWANEIFTPFSGTHVVNAADVEKLQQFFEDAIPRASYPAALRDRRRWRRLPMDEVEVGGRPGSAGGMQPLTEIARPLGLSAKEKDRLKSRLYRDVQRDERQGRRGRGKWYERLEEKTGRWGYSIRFDPVHVENLWSQMLPKPSLEAVLRPSSRKP